MQRSDRGGWGEDSIMTTRRKAHLRRTTKPTTRLPRPRTRPESSGGPEATIRATGPGDLVTLIPYLLGYHPAESLVVAVLAGRRIQMCARLDLADVTHPEVLRAAVANLTRSEQSAALILIAYSSDRQLSCSVLDRAAAELSDRDDAVVLEALYADGRRWWSRSCGDGCCPADGTPYGGSDSSVAAEAVFAGLCVASGREAIAASVAGPPSADWTRLRARLTALADASASAALSRSDLGDARLTEIGVSGRQRMMQQLVRRATGPVSRPSGSSELPDEDTALLLALLARDVAVRDAAWALISPREADSHIALWSRVVSCCVPELASGPLCLLGVAAWIGGNGTLQMCCVDRAQQLDPGYSMAELLSELNRRAVPPELWNDIAPGLRGEIRASVSGR